MGKLADIVILSDNLLTCDPMAINKIVVLETIKEGATVYQQQSHEALPGRFGESY